MEELRHPIPEWVTRGKTIRQLIDELRSFENQDMEVLISLENGESHHVVSILGKYENKYCVLVNAESYYQNGWQNFMDRDSSEVAIDGG